MRPRRVKGLLVLDFGALPPEFNSARMYSGPGSGSLMTGASSWNALAAELNAAALSYDKVITALSSEEWLGPASGLMAQAAAPYVAWMTTTAAQAEQAATQAQAAAAAYETALAAMVPPPLVAANRAQLLQLMQTNVLGQNTGAIAQLEAQYGEMWAQDATAMYSYAGRSATVTKMASFKQAPQVSNASAQTTQGTAVASATGTSAGATQSTLSQVVSSTPNVLQNLASPTTNATTAASGLGGIWQLLTGSTTAPTSLSGLVTAYNPFASFFI